MFSLFSKKVNEDEKSRMAFLFHPKHLSWLVLPLGQWKDNQADVAAEQFVKNFKVTNDVAAQGVKIASDLANISSRDSKIRQMI